MGGVQPPVSGYVEPMLPGSGLPWEAPLGAFPIPGGNTRFRVWAPRVKDPALDRDGAQTRMEPAGLGVFEAEVPASLKVPMCSSYTTRSSSPGAS